jgi:hypothetical protein
MSEVKKIKKTFGVPETLNHLIVGKYIPVRVNIFIGIIVFGGHLNLIDNIYKNLKCMLSKGFTVNIFNWNLMR